MKTNFDTAKTARDICRVIEEFFCNKNIFKDQLTKTHFSLMALFNSYKNLLHNYWKQILRQLSIWVFNY